MRRWKWLVVALTTGFTGFSQQASVRLERVTRIGCIDCDGPEMFAGIQAIAVGNGRVIVADRSAPYLRVFDVNGKTLKAFAAKGNGPGEQQLPVHVSPRAGHGLEVYDMTLRRFTRYDSVGGVVATRTINGFAALVTSPVQPAESYIITTDFRTQEQPILVLTDAAREPTRLLSLGADFPRLAADEHARTPAFAARPGGGFAVGDGINEYRIRRYDRQGKTLGDIVRNVQRRRKTPEEIEQERTQFDRRRARIQSMVRAERGSPGAVTFTPRPEWNHFNIDALQYDESGRLWVRTERGGVSATIFDLFNADGGYLGELRVAEKLGPFALGNGYLAARVTDENEVEYVGIWRVR